MHVGEIIVEMSYFLSERLSTGKGILRMLLWQIHMPEVSSSSHNRTGKFKPFSSIHQNTLKKREREKTQRVMMSEIQKYYHFV